MCNPTRSLFPCGSLEDAHFATAIEKKRWPKKSAFTLFELLLVMGILLVLAGMTIGIAEGLQRRSARATARGQLALLLQALDSYKMHHGDYPWIDAGSDGSGELYAALIGNRSPAAGFQPKAFGHDPLAGVKGRHFIELSQFNTALKPVSSDGSPQQTLDQGFGDNYLIDPWGSAYVYQYTTIGESPSSGDWKRPGYILMSIGPDGAAGPALPLDGILNAAYFDNESSTDNIFSVP